MNKASKKEASEDREVSSTITVTGIRLFADAVERKDQWACDLLSAMERCFDAISELSSISRFS